MPDLSPDTLILGLAWWAVFVFSTCLHEAGHAWAAYRLGDPTAYHGGQVTLNPQPHIRREPIGMIAAPIITFLINGWMLGWASAPYNPMWAASYPRRAALMALAGPAGNLILVLAAALLMRLGLETNFFYPPETVNFTTVVAGRDGIASSLALLLSIFFMLNMLLMLFNLLPLPPLDGSGAVPLLLEDNASRKYLSFINTPGFAIIGLIIAWNVFGAIFEVFWRPLLNLLYTGITQYG